MVKKSSGKKPGSSRGITISLNPRDLSTIERFRLEDGQHRSSVIREALEALREKRRYAAKRAIERPALPPKPEKILEAVPQSRVRSYPVVDERPRLTTNLDPGTHEAFGALAEQSGQTKAELLRGLVQNVVEPDGPEPVRKDVVTRKSQVIFFSKLFISALEEAVDYDPKRHHNAPPPALRLEDEGYLDEIRSLIAELKRLNENLEKAAKAEEKTKPKRTPAPRRAAEKSAIDVSKHVNTFLNKYSSALGTGAAALTIGTAGALLYQLGVPLDFILKHSHR